MANHQGFLSLKKSFTWKKGYLKLQRKSAKLLFQGSPDARGAGNAEFYGPSGCEELDEQSTSTLDSNKGRLQAAPLEPEIRDQFQEELQNAIRHYLKSKNRKKRPPPPSPPSRPRKSEESEQKDESVKLETAAAASTTEDEPKEGQQAIKLPEIPAKPRSKIPDEVNEENREDPELIPEADSSENDSDDYYSVKGTDNALYETLTKYRKHRRNLSDDQLYENLPGAQDKSDGSTVYDDFTDEEPIYENENLCEEDPIYENIEYSQTRTVEVDGLIRRAARPKVPPKPDAIGCSSSEATRSECGDIDDKASSFGDSSRSDELSHPEERETDVSLTPPDERSPKHSDDESDVASKDSEDRADSGIEVVRSSSKKASLLESFLEEKVESEEVDKVWEQPSTICQEAEENIFVSEVALNEAIPVEAIQPTAGGELAEVTISSGLDSVIQVSTEVAEEPLTCKTEGELENCSIKPTEGKTIIEIFSCSEKLTSSDSTSLAGEEKDVVEMNRKEAIAQGLFSASFIRVEDAQPMSLKLLPSTMEVPVIVMEKLDEQPSSMPADLMTGTIRGVTTLFNQEEPESLVAALSELENKTLAAIPKPKNEPKMTSSEPETVLESQPKSHSVSKKHDYLNIDEACMFLTRSKHHDYVNVEDAQVFANGAIESESLPDWACGLASAKGMHDARDYVNLMPENDVVCGNKANGGQGAPAAKARFLSEMRGSGDYVNFPTDPFLELECDLFGFDIIPDQPKMTETGATPAANGREQAAKDTKPGHEDGAHGGETVEESLKCMELERRRIIETQTVKMKYIDSWIKSTEAESLKISPNDHESDHEREDCLPQVVGKLDEAKYVEFQQLTPPKVSPVPETRSKREIKRGQMVKSTRPTNLKLNNGEVDDASILANKETTKSYWEAKLLEAAENQKNLLIKNIAADSLTQAIASSVGQTAAMLSENKNARMVAEVGDDSKDLRNGAVVSPPPEFRLDGKSHSVAEESDQQNLAQYVYGENGEVPSDAVPRHINIIEQEIREQQLREAALRQEGALKAARTDVPPGVVADVDAGADADDEDGGHDRGGLDFSEDGGCAEFPEFDPTAPVVAKTTPKIPLTVASTPMAAAAVRAVSPVTDDDAGVESVIAGPTTPSLTAGTDDNLLGDDMSPPSACFDPCQYSTEAKIALEIRELKEREEELRRMRSRFQSAGIHSQDNLISLPTSSSTDEGNCSEYGSGEDASNKEVASIEGGGSSRLTSPEIPSNGLGFLHQRTQSMDSVSSGHSSTPSNGVAHPTSGMALSASYADFYSKRRVTVKPLADPEDEEESSYKPLKETPMEREIRLAREREEELRRIRAYQASFQQTKVDAPAPTFVTPKVPADKERSPTHPGWDLGGKTEVVKPEPEKLARKLSGSEPDAKYTPGFVKTPPVINPTVSAGRGARRLVGYAGLHKLMNPPTAPIGGTSTKGLMEKFLASRGKMSTVLPTFSTSTDTAARNVKTTHRPAVAKPVQQETFTSPKPFANIEDDASVARRQSTGAAPKQVIRRPYATAEEKIQLELQEMKMREKELREQRMRALARSQPNLLAAFDDEDDDSDGGEDACKNGYPRLCDNGIMNGGGSGIPRCQSNPNLLDDDAASTISDASSSAVYSNQTGSKAPRRKSALIAQWESMIQQQTNTAATDEN